MELDYEGELKGADTIARELIRTAVGRVFSKHFAEASFQPVIQWFELGGELKLPELATTADRCQQLSKIQGLMEHIGRLGVTDRKDAGAAASAAGNDSGRFVGASPHRPQRRTRFLCGQTKAAGAARNAVVAWSAPPVQLTTATKASNVSAKGIFMKFIRYGKYVGEPADAVDLEELIKRLGDFFLQSGFESQFYGVSRNGSRTAPWKPCVKPSSAPCKKATSSRKRP